jgi:uncharacterized protein
MSLNVFRCTHCGTTLFPARYLCPACGGGEWTECDASRGTVSAATVVRYRVAAQSGADILLASVRTQAGPTVIARIDAALEPGDTVSLTLDAEHRIRASRV